MDFVVSVLGIVGVAWLLLKLGAPFARKGAEWAVETPDPPRGFASTAPVRTDTAFMWAGTDDFDVEVVGESYYQSAIAAAARAEQDGELVAELIPEDTNRHDPNAVRVDILGRTVGYLSREDAASFRRRLAAKKLTGQLTRCAAMTTGGPENRRDSYGVQLDMKPFDF